MNGTGQNSKPRMKIVDVSHLKDADVHESRAYQNTRNSTNNAQQFMQFYMSMYKLDDDYSCDNEVYDDEQFADSELYAYLTRLNRSMWETKPARVTESGSKLKQRQRRRRRHNYQSQHRYHHVHYTATDFKSVLIC